MQIREMNVKDFDEYRTKYADNSALMPSIVVGTFLWGVGTMVNKGYLDIDMVDRLMGHDIVIYWEKVKSFVPERRKIHGPDYAADLEYLCNTLVQRRQARAY
jgi:hypothetical protein